MQRGPTRDLAEYAAKASFKDLPQQIVESAKLYILDAFGNMIGGSTLKAARIILDLFQEMDGKSESTILATGQKVPCLHAAYVNAALANMLDMDDTYANWFHAGGPIVSSALAVAEKKKATGKEFINSVVIGYEVALRVGLAIWPSPSRYLQVAGLATPLIFGTATAAGKLLGLDVDQMATAFGHAGFSATPPFIWKNGQVPEERPFSWLKNNMGWTSMGGVLASFLAEKGLVGNQCILDGPRGFWIIAGSDQCDFTKFAEGLGEKYLMPDIGFKPYAACRWTHTTLDAVHEILSRTKIEPVKVRNIRVRGYSELAKNFCGFEPAGEIDAQFSIPYIVALVIAGYSPVSGWAENHLKDKVVVDLVKKIGVEIDPEAEEAFFKKHQIHSKVTIEMEDGCVLEAAKKIAKWEPEHPPSREDIEAKFVNITNPIIGQDKASGIVKGVRELEGANTVRELIGV